MGLCTLGYLSDIPDIEVPPSINFVTPTLPNHIHLALSLYDYNKTITRFASVLKSLLVCIHDIGWCLAICNLLFNSLKIVYYFIRIASSQRL